MDNNTYYATGTEQENVKTEKITQFIEAFAQNCTTYKEREYSGMRFTMSESDEEKRKSGYGKQFLFDYGKDGVVFLEVYQDDNYNQHLAIEAMVKGEDGAKKFVENVNSHVDGENWFVEENKTFNPVDFDRFRRNRYCNFNNDHKYFSDKFFYISDRHMNVKEKRVSDLYKTGVVLPKNFEVERTTRAYENEKADRWYKKEDNINAVVSLGALAGGLAGGLYGGYEAASYIYGATQSYLFAGVGGLMAMGITRKVGAVAGAIALPAVTMTLSGLKNTISDALFSKEQDEILENNQKLKFKLNEKSLLYQCAHGFKKDNVILQIRDTNDFSVSKILDNNKEGFLIASKLDGEEKLGIKILPKDNVVSFSPDKDGNYTINKKDVRFVLEYENGGNQYSKTIDFSQGSSFGNSKTDIKGKSAELAQLVESVITHDVSCVPEKYQTYIPKEIKELSHTVTQFSEVTQEQKRSLKPKEKVLSNSKELDLQM